VFGGLPCGLAFGGACEGVGERRGVAVEGRTVHFVFVLGPLGHPVVALGPVVVLEPEGCVAYEIGGRAAADLKQGLEGDDSRVVEGGSDAGVRVGGTRESAPPFHEEPVEEAVAPAGLLLPHAPQPLQGVSDHVNRRRTRGVHAPKELG